MEKKSNGLLKVTGIIMIIGGALAIILGIIAVAGVGLVASLNAALGGDVVNTGLLTVSSILVLVGGIVELVAGILGVKNSAIPEKAGTCIIFGILTIVISILSTILGVVAGGEFKVVNLLIGLVLPILYLIGAFQSKAAIGQDPQL